MFDLGWQEFMLIAFVAVVVVGPRDLPRVVRSVSTYIRKARSVAREFQNSLEEVAREAELDDLRKEAKSISGGNLEKKMNEWVDPSGETQKEMERIASQAKDVASSRPVDSPAEDKPDASPEPAAEQPPAAEEKPKPETKSAEKSAAAGQ
ncbi:Sec-independent protein translocase protein TatB [Nisaea acidiphila]|uniref:Sec-independent protein translocase protein TatB n=1 Tax=Nisaea acidiphila TaxID=1862145 RepID=A0A9J7ARW3_9PROT|nr:Sec-independent protein translocase protein TatB [Nisaea acidiphila]UUX50096.1 Sec-independent protein translocase protein TatB [Nisaea acidiphila]